MQQSKHIFTYKKHWAHRLGVAPFLPMSRAEMDVLGWDACDVILVTGDAYVDHPSFGMAIVGRLLEAQGFRVGIIAQPDWQNAEDFKVLGQPTLFFGVTAGNMDSMVNRYTSDRKIRSDDAYTPNEEPNKRPDRATLVYSQRCREAYPETPIIIGGIEASLRRIAHYDYWSDLVRRSILIDSKADMLIFGNAERALVEVAHRLAKNEPISELKLIRGTAVVRKKSDPFPDVVAVVRLPSYEHVKENKIEYAKASREAHLQSNPLSAKPMVQAHGDRDVWINPPPMPLTTEELDAVYELPYQRKPHPAYQDAKMSAYEMIRFSVNIMRGCFGGCTFCSITQHEGRIIQSRSEESILKEIETVRDKTPGFTGIISDLGGPSANMYRMECQNKEAQACCKKTSCVYPAVCPNMNINHDALIKLYRKARQIKGVKKILIASGVRYDLANHSPEYIQELARYHVGGYLKIAPEHISPNVLSKMQKTSIDGYDQFQQQFERFSREAGKEQYLIPYFIAAHPGTTDEDMLELALWLKKNNLRLDQVQNFLPTPMTLATTMYYTEKNPLQKVDEKSEHVIITKSEKTRRLYKAFLRYHDPANWPIIREALIKMGREDLIGNNNKIHLVPLR
jgi:uncharacterized radical SAM protein YgiQ